MSDSLDSHEHIRWFHDLSSADREAVGGKNASLGEMIRHLDEAGIRVPPGYALTADAYVEFVDANDLREPLARAVERLRAGEVELAEAGRSIRQAILGGRIPGAIQRELREAYRELGRGEDGDGLPVAVRSSATAEDLPRASFAGQQETYLNVKGEEELLEAVRRCYASLFTDRAISYRADQGFDDLAVRISVGVQRMVRADVGSAGVTFSIDTETGFPDAVVISASWGLGETVVQGRVNPDQYMVYKPFLDREGTVPIVERMLGDKKRKLVFASEAAADATEDQYTSDEERFGFVLADEEVLRLARWTRRIEEHYGQPVDVEWAKDGVTGEIFVVQARPETVQSRRDTGSIYSYRLLGSGEARVSGVSVGDAVATGPVRRILDVADADRVQEGDVLVTKMTDPDWVPYMKKVAAIITDTGGRTCHAAIVSRELGIPAIVGTGDGTDVLADGEEVTVSCAEGDEGLVYDGVLEYEESELEVSDLPETRTRLMINLGSPAAAFRWWRLPTDGVGLARMEFIVGNRIRVHPMALVRYGDVEDEAAREEIDRLTRGYPDRETFFVEHLARGLAKIACVHHPEPVIVRMSDFKTNEYADLIGGAAFETSEANPMLGFRGASRYYSDRYRPGFELECRAIRMAREEIGTDNIRIMIPFCRTLEEADRVLDVLAENGLERGREGLEVYVMCEVPSNAVLAEEFAERFDGFSIGSNDLTQLVLGVDRDSGELAFLFDERNEAVTRTVSQVIEGAHARDCKVGLCGQAPSDHPEFAEFLVRSGIDSMSLNPDSFVGVLETVAAVEAELDTSGAAAGPDRAHSESREA